jgi:hypothetical protein
MSYVNDEVLSDLSNGSKNIENENENDHVVVDDKESEETEEIEISKIEESEETPHEISAVSKEKIQSTQSSIFDEE